MIPDARQTVAESASKPLVHGRSSAWWAACCWGALCCAASASSETVVVDYAVDATIQGVVQRQDGTPVPEAGLTARMYEGVCGIGDWSIWPLVSSDADGRFEETLWRFGSSFSACLVVIAEPPAMSGLKPDSVSGIYLTFGAPGDTASVVLTLLPSDVP